MPAIVIEHIISIIKKLSTQEENDLAKSWFGDLTNKR